MCNEVKLLTVKRREKCRVKLCETIHGEMCELVSLTSAEAMWQCSFAGSLGFTRWHAHLHHPIAAAAPSEFGSLTGERRPSGSSDAGQPCPQT